MKRNQWFVAVGLALMVIAGLTACSTRGPHGEVDQAAIEANIRSQVATHYPGETFDLGIDVSDSGVVTLKGDVNNSDKKVRIGEIAQNTPGVTGVVNDIVVKT